jgi:hypothetical protein
MRMTGLFEANGILSGTEATQKEHIAWRRLIIREGPLLFIYIPDKRMIPERQRRQLQSMFNHSRMLPATAKVIAASVEFSSQRCGRGSLTPFIIQYLTPPTRPIPRMNHMPLQSTIDIYTDLTLLSIRMHQAGPERPRRSSIVVKSDAPHRGMLFRPSSNLVHVLTLMQVARGSRQVEASKMRAR